LKPMKVNCASKCWLSLLLLVCFLFHQCNIDRTAATAPEGEGLCFSKD
jgi:hypothetical protein